MKKLPWIVTVIWVIAVIVVPFFCLTDKLPSHLNEWGDYLAGAFSPLAFFWLIMGYLQQGEELKNSIKEQRNSVEEQRKLYEIQEKQFIAQKLKVKPNLYVKQKSFIFDTDDTSFFDDNTGEYIEGEIINYLSICLEVINEGLGYGLNITLEDYFEKTENLDFLKEKNNASMTITYTLESLIKYSKNKVNFRIPLVLSFSDLYDEIYVKDYYISLSNFDPKGTNLNMVEVNIIKNLKNIPPH